MFISRAADMTYLSTWRLKEFSVFVADRHPLTGLLSVSVSQQNFFMKDNNSRMMVGNATYSLKKYYKEVGTFQLKVFPNLMLYPFIFGNYSAWLFLIALGRVWLGLPSSPPPPPPTPLPAHPRHQSGRWSQEKLSKEFWVMFPTGKNEILGKSKV